MNVDQLFYLQFLYCVFAGEAIPVGSRGLRYDWNEGHVTVSIAVVLLLCHWCVQGDIQCAYVRV